MLEQVGNQVAKFCCNKLLLAHSANFLKLTFVFVSHIFGEDFCTLACCAPRQLPLSAPPPRYATAVSCEIYYVSVACTLSDLLYYVAIDFSLGLPTDDLYMIVAVVC